TNFNNSSLFFSFKFSSNSILESKWSSIERLLLPVTTKISSIPEAIASSTINWIVGLSTIGSISFAIAFVAGKNRVPNPAAGMIAFLTFFISFLLSSNKFYLSVIRISYALLQYTKFRLFFLVRKNISRFLLFTLHLITDAVKSVLKID